MSPITVELISFGHHNKLLQVNLMYNIFQMLSILSCFVFVCLFLLFVCLFVCL